jgi:DNA primase
MTFDILAYLDDKGIPYKPGGKNIGKGWIGIHCPFPNCSDHSQHLGIHKKSGIFSCWICGEKGPADKLVSAIEECSYNQARAIMEAYPGFDDIDEPIIARTPGGYQGKIMPDEANKDFHLLHTRWLESRRFNPRKIIKQYDLYCVYNSGRWRGRIVAPIYLDNRLVSYITRDTTGNSTLPYIDCPEEECLIPPKRTLYNIDRMKDRAILVEGITDVWRIGDGAIASFTSNMTMPQKKLLIDKRPKNLFIMYDEDAQSKARVLAHELAPYMSTELIKLEFGDPADLSYDEAMALRRDLLQE